MSQNLFRILELFMAYRFIVAVIELRQGMSRIICLDIEEITAKEAGKNKIVNS